MSDTTHNEAQSKKDSKLESTHDNTYLKEDSKEEPTHNNIHSKGDSNNFDNRDSKNLTNVDSNHSIHEDSKKHDNSDSNYPDLESTQQENGGKIKGFAKGMNELSLGISMIVAVLLGLGLGYLLYKLTGYYWCLWIGLGYGVAAAALNVIRAYKKLYKELDSLKNEEKYKYMQDRILEEMERKKEQKKQNTESL